jgi:hypothetical protein
VASFVGIACDDDDIAEVAERGSFEKMRSLEDAHGAESYPGALGERAKFVRRGEADAWKDELKPATAARIEETFAPAMRAAGYTR